MWPLGSSHFHLFQSTKTWNTSEQLSNRISARPGVLFFCFFYGFNFRCSYHPGSRVRHTLALLRQHFWWSLKEIGHPGVNCHLSGLLSAHPVSRTPPCLSNSCLIDPGLTSPWTLSPVCLSLMVSRSSLWLVKLPTQITHSQRDSETVATTCFSPAWAPQRQCL